MSDNTRLKFVCARYSNYLVDIEFGLLSQIYDKKKNILEHRYIFGASSKPISVIYSLSEEVNTPEFDRELTTKMCLALKCYDIDFSLIRSVKPWDGN